MNIMFRKYNYRYGSKGREKYWKKHGYNKYEHLCFSIPFPSYTFDKTLHFIIKLKTL